MRLFEIIIGYFTACLAGALLFSAYFTIFGAFPVGVTRFLGDVVLAFGIGSVMALPIAVPLIVISEKRSDGPLWIFFLVGPIVAILMMALFRVRFELEAFLIASSILTIPSMTYWLIAWKLFPSYEAPIHLHENHD